MRTILVPAAAVAVFCLSFAAAGVAQDPGYGKLTPAPVPGPAVGDGRDGPALGAVGRTAPGVPAGGSGVASSYATAPALLGSNGPGALNTVAPNGAMGTRAGVGTSGSSASVGSSAGGQGAIGLGGTGSGTTTGLGIPGNTNNGVGLNTH